MNYPAPLQTMADNIRDNPKKKYPVTEIFGPTIQGEGIDQGLPCYFIRFGGCDFKCEWCDTPHAVLPERVRASKRLTDDDILLALSELADGPRMVVLSGGNPALHDLSTLVQRLHLGHLGTGRSYTTSVETQGTLFKPWVAECKRICVSPKPPSSGMHYTAGDLVTFLSNFPLDDYDKWWTGRLFIKIVVFDQRDYEWAKDIFMALNEETGGVGFPYYLSAGNDAGATVGNPSRRDNRSLEQVRSDLLNRYLWLVNRVMVDPLMADVTVQAQSHVLAWGNELGR